MENCIEIRVCTSHWAHRHDMSQASNKQAQTRQTHRFETAVKSHKHEQLHRPFFLKQKKFDACGSNIPMPKSVPASRWKIHTRCNKYPLDKIQHGKTRPDQTSQSSSFMVPGVRLAYVWVWSLSCVGCYLSISYFTVNCYYFII